MAYNINKTLYVGIGGTGAKTLVKIKRHFIDAYGEIPDPMIGFLAIDTQDGIKDSAVAKSGSEINGQITTLLGNKPLNVKDISSKEIRLADSEVKCVSATNAFNVYSSQKNEFTWMPQPPSGNADALTNIKATGAGQVRSNGCFIARYNQDEIKSRIIQSLSLISAPLPVDSKFQLGKGKTPGIPSRTTINVICSISGGSGSGMLIDILEIIQSAIGSTGSQCDVIPWIVMPDIYKQITPTGSFNVYYNTYGTLRDLDFIFENATTRHIPFGSGSISYRLFDFAYIINNVSKSGSSFNSLDDLLDDVAKCAFLPSGDMGTQADEMKDNIIANQDTFSLDNKRAWASSVSSAEMIYDNETVGFATSYAIANKLIALLLNTTQSGSTLCDNFVDRQDVKIRETGGNLHNDVIDAICDLNSIQPFEVEKGTEAADIVNRLQLISNDATLEANCELKSSKTTALLTEEVCKIISSKDGGGLGNAIAFLAALNGFIDSCLEEMTSEAAALERKLSQTPDWSAEIKECHGFLGMFRTETAADLSENVNMRMRDMQDLKRHQQAILFYTKLKETASTYKNLLSAKADILRSTSQNFDAELSKLRNSCKPKSKFQVYLHLDAMRDIDPVVSQQMWNDFCDSPALPSNSNLSDWLALDHSSLRKRIFRFAGKTAAVSDEFKKTIEDVLREKSTEELVKLTKYVLDLASPMWTLDYHGKLTKNVSLGRQVLVGVPDMGHSIMKSDNVIDALTYDTTSPKFASTYQTDRIYIMMTESSAPIFAINNFKTYENDYNERIKSKNGLSCSIDIRMDALRDSMDFSMWPAAKPAIALDLWTQAFCFEAQDGQTIIRFDKENHQYWMRSRKYGNAIQNYRYNLGELRTVAYNQFQICELFNEVQEAIDVIIKEKGSKFIADRLDSMRGTDFYYKNCVIPNMNPAECDGLGSTIYNDVTALITQEIDLRTSRKS